MKGDGPMKPQRARVMMWISLALMGMVGLPALPAGTVSLNPYTYTVEGQLSMLGNDVCTPSPCMETLNFSFLFQWVHNSIPGLDQFYLGMSFQGPPA
jgi:hypothetical protein